MTTFGWHSATSGDWSLPGLWTPAGGPPNSATAGAVIGAAGSDYTVTQDVGTTDTLDSLALSDAAATLDIDGTLRFAAGGALNVTAGTLDLSGTIQGAAITNAGGDIQYSGGTLDGVTYRGTLNAMPGNAIYITGGITLTGAAGTGPGAVNTGLDSTVYVVGSQTLDNATITLLIGQPEPNSDFTTGLAGFDPTDAGATLTLGAHLVVRDVGANGYSHGFLEDGGQPGDSLVNDGQILGRNSGGQFIIGGNSFINNGTVDAFGNNSLISIESTHFSNVGSISVAAGSTLSVTSSTLSNSGTITDTGGFLQLGSAWSNTGTITVTDGTLQLGTDSPTAWGNIGSITAPIRRSIWAAS